MGMNGQRWPWNSKAHSGGVCGVVMALLLGKPSLREAEDCFRGDTQTSMSRCFINFR
jgi:hypothetical protein